MRINAMGSQKRICNVWVKIGDDDRVQLGEKTVS
uniref:Uncharacterized protein n=1 Tax=Arundo donax TaxID=35708 RepID=A0A0A8Z4Y3_ARUDO